MNISYAGLHLESDPKTKAYADTKVKKLARFDSRITDIKIRLFSEKNHRNEQHDFYCELTIHVPGKVLEIVDKERDLTKAIDKASERMKKVLIRHKEKEVTKMHRQGIFRKILGRIR